MAKSLDSVIKKANSLANIISKRVAYNAPKKTGNLQRALLRANTLNTMLDVGKGSSKSIPLKTITFSIDYAPDGAEYGMWWNDPTVSNTVENQGTGNTDSINFAEQAIYSPIVDSMLNDYMDEIGKMVVEQISKAVDDLK